MKFKKENKSHEWFLEQLLMRNEHYIDGKFKVLTKYEGNRSFVYTQDKYGICYMRCANMLLGYKPSARCCVNREDYLHNVVYEKNRHFQQGEFKIFLKDMTNQIVFIQTDSFVSEININSLTQGYMPHKISAIDKKEVFFNELAASGISLPKDILKVLEVKNNGDVIFRTKYGLCKTKMTRFKLEKINNITISLALDKTQYFKNILTEKFGDKYDYSLVDYKNSRTKVKIICPKHGVFEQKPSRLLLKGNCPSCSKEIISNYRFSYWNKKCPGNPGVFYFLECWDEETGEHFYKIGRTCNSVKHRYKYKGVRMPYEWKIIRTVSDYDRRLIWDLELELKKVLKPYSHKCEKHFAGATTEAFQKSEEVKQIINDKIQRGAFTGDMCGTCD